MHKFGFSAKSAIAWLRLCRPGSVVGDQQQFMDSLFERDELQKIMKSAQNRLLQINRGKEPSVENLMRKQRGQPSQGQKKQESPERKKIPKNMFRDDSEDEKSDGEEFKGSDYIRQYYQNKYGSSFNQNKRKSSNYDVKVDEKKRRLMEYHENKKINFYGRRDSTSSDREKRRSNNFKSP